MWCYKMKYYAQLNDYCFLKLKIKRNHTGEFSNCTLITAKCWITDPLRKLKKTKLYFSRLENSMFQDEVYLTEWSIRRLMAKYINSEWTAWSFILT